MNILARGRVGSWPGWAPPTSVWKAVFPLTSSGLLNGSKCEGPPLPSECAATAPRWDKQRRRRCAPQATWNIEDGNADRTPPASAAVPQGRARPWPRAAAAKAHIETLALEQARADLNVITTRSNTPRNALSLQWSLPDA